MGTENFRRRGRNRPDVSEDWWDYLTDNVQEGDQNFSEFASDREIQEKWETCRAAIIVEFRNDPTRCGTRPTLWWRFDAPQPTRRILNVAEGQEVPGGGRWRGIALMWSVRECVEWESEFTYLQRHGLVMPNEQGDAQPTVMNYAQRDTLHRYYRVNDVVD